MSGRKKKQDFQKKNRLPKASFFGLGLVTLLLKPVYRVCNLQASNQVPHLMKGVIFMSDTYGIVMNDTAILGLCCEPKGGIRMNKVKKRQSYFTKEYKHQAATSMQLSIHDRKISLTAHITHEHTNIYEHTSMAAKYRMSGQSSRSPQESHMTSFFERLWSWAIVQHHTAPQTIFRPGGTIFKWFRDMQIQDRVCSSAWYHDFPGSQMFLPKD